MDSSWCSFLTLWIYITALLTGASGIQNIYSSGCSGDRVNLQCPEFHKIAIKRLFYGVKNDTRCGGVAGATHPIDCCQPTHNDCLVVDDTKYPFLNMLCSGHRGGCDIEANSIEAGPSCKAKGYGTMTDYMSVIHDCIPDDDIAGLCSDSHIQGKLVYLANNNYPRPISAGARQCQCLIKTSRHIGLHIHALDVIITRTEVGNICTQDIEIKDDEGTQKQITCGHSGLYGFRNIYNRDVRYVTLTLNTRANQSQGYVWLQAKAGDSNDHVDVYCGKDMRIYLGHPPDDDIETTEASLTTTSVAPDIISDIETLIAGIAVALAMIIIIGVIGIIILCVRRSRQKREIRRNQLRFPSPILKSKEGHSSNSYCKYDYDEDKYLSIKRSPLKMAKYSNIVKSPNQKLKEAFLDGVAKTEATDQNSYENYNKEMIANHLKPLLESKDETDANSDTSEIFLPKSEYIIVGRANEPKSVMREISVSTLPGKRKNIKNKTVTFSPVAMVTPLPFGSDESVPDNFATEDLKCNIFDIHSKTLPARSTHTLPPPDKTSKVVIVPGSKDDTYLPMTQNPGCEFVTEEDLWKAFRIKLDEDDPPPPEPMETEDPDYDENPYDNIPYVNVCSLRRKNAPDECSDTLPEPIYKDIQKGYPKRNCSQKPTVESISEVES